MFLIEPIHHNDPKGFRGPNLLSKLNMFFHQVSINLLEGIISEPIGFSKNGLFKSCLY